MSMSPILVSAGITAAGNLLNTGLSMYAQNDYMRRWGSPEAQMEHMINAGINPYSAAGKIQGAAGDSPVGAGLQSMTGMDAAAVSNSLMNPTVQRNMDSNSDKNEAEARGQEIQNEINDTTKADQIRRNVADANFSEANARNMEVIAERQPDLMDATIGELNGKIWEHNANVQLANKQLKRLDEEIENLKEERKKIRAEVSYLRSSKELADANTRIAGVQKRIAELEEQRLEVEVERYKRTGEAEWFIQVYDEIYQKEGKESAEEWLNHMYGAIEAYQMHMSRGASTGSDPVMYLSWKQYSDIESAEQYIKQLDKQLEEMTAEVTALAGDKNVSGDDYLKAQEELDNVVNTFKEKKVELRKAEQAFRRGLEYRGFRDPRKFYKEDWLDLGKTVADIATKIYGIKRLGDAYQNKGRIVVGGYNGSGSSGSNTTSTIGYSYK